MHYKQIYHPIKILKPAMALYKRFHKHYRHTDFNNKLKAFRTTAAAAPCLWAGLLHFPYHRLSV